MSTIRSFRPEVSVSAIFAFVLASCAGEIEHQDIGWSDAKPGDGSLSQEKGAHDGPVNPADSKAGEGLAKDASLCAGHCKNKKLDCGETYIDCGGPDCPPCKPVKLASTAGGYVKVSAAAANKVMVVYHRSASGGDNHIRWTCFNGQAWTQIDRVTAGSGLQEYPWLARDSKGHFHLAHNDGGADARHVHYNVYDASGCGGKWNTKAEVLPRTQNFSAAYAAVSVDENDAPYITWSQSLSKRVSPFPPCDSSGKCSAAHTHCYPLQKICVPDYQQHFSRRQGGAWGSGKWTKPVNIAAGAPGAVFSHHGAIFAQHSTRVHAVWMHGDPQREIYYSQFDGTKWSKPEFTHMGGHVADVQADKSTVYVFSNRALFATRPVSPFSGAKWSSITTIGSGTVINFIKLKLDTSGLLHAVWNSNYRVMYSATDAKGKWQPAKALSPSGQSAHEPSLDVDSQGFVHIVWTQCTSPSCAGEFGSVWYLKTKYSQLP